jgi:hypothetical protein
MEGSGNFWPVLTRYDFMERASRLPTLCPNQHISCGRSVSATKYQMLTWCVMGSSHLAVLWTMILDLPVRTRSTVCRRVVRTVVSRRGRSA